MTTVGTLSADIGPSNNSMDLPTAPNNTVPLIVTTAADDDKAVLAHANNDNSMNYMQPVSKLDMEPNPFEQSFSDLTPEKAGPPSGNSAPAPEAPKPTLPPIASMSGRLAPNNEQYGWEAQSLRMGPLSPSMLEGPQDPIPVGSYPATTAAISTIYTSGAPMAENGYAYAGMPGSVAPPAGPVQTAEPYPPAIYNQTAQAPRQPQPFPHMNGQAPMNDRYIPPQGVPHPDNVHGYNSMQNLTQAQAAAQREMWVKRESIDANGYFPGQPQQQQQHHAAQNGQNASGMVGTQGRDSRPSRMTSEDSDDSQFSRQSSVSGEPGNNGKNGGSNGNKKRPAAEDKMDEEEKRKNFLERNRQAALKCRQRKKQWLSNLQAKVEYLTTDNEHLQTQTASLRDEIIHLKALLLAHKECPVAQANGVYAHTIGVANNHSGGMMPPTMQGQASQQQQQQRGVGQRGGSMPQPAQQMQAGGARVAISSASGGPAVSTATSQGQSIRY